MPPPIAELCLFPAKIYSNACNITSSEPLPGCLHPSLSPPWCLTVYNVPQIQTPHQSLRIRVNKNPFLLTISDIFVLLNQYMRKLNNFGMDSALSLSLSV